MANTTTGYSQTFLGFNVASIQEEVSNLKQTYAVPTRLDFFSTNFSGLPTGVTTFNFPLPTFATGSYNMAGQPLLHGIVTVEEALRYAMSLPVATTICGIDSLSVLRQNLALARNFKAMTDAEMQALRQRCSSFAADGHLELYKSTKKYDADVGREQHGYPSQEQLPV